VLQVGLNLDNLFEAGVCVERCRVGCHYWLLVACCGCCCFQGTPNPLLSSFRLSYYTLLNLLKRVEGGTDSLEYVIAHSFQQFQQEAARPRVSCCVACMHWTWLSLLHAHKLGQVCAIWTELGQEQQQHA
jgi:hypothetical protein